MDSELQDALNRIDAWEVRPDQIPHANLTTLLMFDLGIAVKAARKYANIHPSRLHEWHILHVRAGSWGLTHPLDCDLTDCAYQTQAETWDESPDELGNYQWEHEPVLESWTGVTEDV